MEPTLIAKAREGRTKALETLAYRQLFLSNVHTLDQRVERKRQTSPGPVAWASVRNIFQQPAMALNEVTAPRQARQNCGT